MKKTMPQDPISFRFAQRSDTLLWAGEPILQFGLRWPEGGEDCPKGLARLLKLTPAVWESRWRGVLFAQARAALADCRVRSRPFAPWVCRLDGEVTHNEGGLCCVVWTASEQTGSPRRSLLRHALVWDLRADAPRTLRSFFPVRRWRRALFTRVAEQAEAQLTRGDSLLDPGLSRLRRQFSPERFQLRDGRLEVFYPQCAVAAYAEGIPVFDLGPLPVPPDAAPPAPPSLSDFFRHTRAQIRHFSPFV